MGRRVPGVLCDRGALMRGNSKVRALCPVGVRVTEEEPAQGVWDVWAD